MKRDNKRSHGIQNAKCIHLFSCYAGTQLENIEMYKDRQSGL